MARRYAVLTVLIVGCLLVGDAPATRAAIKEQDGVELLINRALLCRK